MTTPAPIEQQKTALLVYDIPERSGMPNPSARLRSLGVRVNLSAWIIPLKNLPVIPVDEWRAAGAVVEVVQFDEREYEKILRLARESLARDIGRMQASLTSAISLLRGELALLKPGEDEKFRKAKDKSYRQFKRATEFADAAEEASLSFMLLGDVKHLIEGLRATVKAKSEIYTRLVESTTQTMKGDNT